MTDHPPPPDEAYRREIFAAMVPGVNSEAEGGRGDVTNQPGLTDAAKRAVFAAVICLQDQDYTVFASRAAVATRFGVTPDVVRRVEREGITRQWPPLGPADRR